MKQNLLYLLLGIFFLASCQQEELTKEQSGYGYLSLKSVVATVENVNQPASRAVPAINKEDLYVEICEGDKTVLSYEPGAEVPVQIQLPIGTYVAKAYNAAYKNKEMVEPAFYGETDAFTITADADPTEQTIHVSLYNVGITFALGENFDDYFSTEKTQLEIVNGSNTPVTVTQFGDGTFHYFYLENNVKPIYTLTSQNADKETVTLSGTLEVENGKCYTLTFTFNPESRSLSVAE